MLQNILQYRFDQLFDTTGQHSGTDFMKEDFSKKNVPLDKLIKDVGMEKISKEEENTFILQVNLQKPWFSWPFMQMDH